MICVGIVLLHKRHYFNTIAKQFLNLHKNSYIGFS